MCVIKVWLIHVTQLKRKLLLQSVPSPSTGNSMVYSETCFSIVHLGVLCGVLLPAWSHTDWQPVQGLCGDSMVHSMTLACSMAHLAPDVLYGVLKADLVKHWLLLQSVQGLSRGHSMAVGQQLMAAQGPRGALQHSHCLPHKQNGLSYADRHTWR